MRRRARHISSPATEASAATDTRAFVERSMSSATRLAYRSNVREFAAFLDCDLLDATPDDVRRWRDEIVRRVQKPRTIARKLMALGGLVPPHRPRFAGSSDPERGRGSELSELPCGPESR